MYHFGAKGSGHSFCFFSSPTISSGCVTRVTVIPFSVQPIIGHGVRVAFDLHFDCFSGQSLGPFDSNTVG